jgi:hypothetical protein
MPLEPAFALVNGRTPRTDVGVDEALTLLKKKPSRRIREDVAKNAG